MRIKLFEDFSEVPKEIKSWKIFAGIGGGFGGANFIERYEGTLEEAESLAYQKALEIYDSYDGSGGLRTIDEIMEDDDVEYEEAEEIYNEERESWLDYYVQEDNGEDEDEDGLNIF